MSKRSAAEEEIIRSSNWIGNFFIREGYHADYTLKSLLEIDKFFKEKMNLALENENNRNFIFSVSAYIGEVIRMKFGGEWIISQEADFVDESMGVSFKDRDTIYPLNITLELIRKKYTIKRYLKDNFGIEI